MAGHLHKSFSDQQVRALLERYIRQEIKLEHILGVLKPGAAGSSSYTDCHSLFRFVQGRNSME